MARFWVGCVTQRRVVGCELSVRLMGARPMTAYPMMVGTASGSEAPSEMALPVTTREYKSAPIMRSIGPGESKTGSARGMSFNLRRISGDRETDGVLDVM